MTKETYLGDGLYAQFDGFNLKLLAPRENGDHEVYLEPNTWNALCSFIKSLELPKGHFDLTEAGQ